jgi:hypothetical protein
MSTKRLLLLVGLVVLLTNVAYFVALRYPGVTKGNFDRVQMGMTASEVEAIFSRDWDIFDLNKPACNVCGRGPDKPRPWCGKSGIAWIEFDDNGRVNSKRWVPYDNSP